MKGGYPMKKSSYLERAGKFAALRAQELEALGYDPHNELRYRLSRIFEEAVVIINERKGWNARPIIDGSTRNVVLCSDYCIKIDKVERSFFGTSKDEYNFFLEHKNDSYGPFLCPISKVVIRDYTFYIMPRVKGVGHTNKNRFPRFIIEDMRDLHNMNIGVFHRQPIIIDYAAGFE